MKNSTKKLPLNLKSDVLSKMKNFNTSGKIRFLHSLKISNGDIARTLTKLNGKEVRPQHVSNVLNTKVTNPVNKF